AKGMGKSSDRQSGIQQLYVGKEGCARIHITTSNLELRSKRQNKKYLCAIGSTSAGSHVMSSPSTRTSYVSGFTSIRGVLSLRIISFLPMLRQLRTGSTRLA